MTEASRIATQGGFPQPVVAQLAYSVVQPLPVEDPKTMAALRECGSGVVASYVLAGGVLTGKYETGSDGRTGRGNARRSAGRSERGGLPESCRGSPPSEGCPLPLSPWPSFWPILTSPVP